MNGRAEIKTSVRKAIPGLLGCLVFVGLGAFLIFGVGDLILTIAAIAAIAFFGFRFFVLLFRIFDRRPRIVIDEKGIEDRRIGVGKIDWEDIKYFDLCTVHQNDAILLKLKNPEKYLKNRSKISKLRSKFDGDSEFGILRLDLGGIDTELRQVYEIIQRYAPEKQLQSGASMHDDLDRISEIK